MSVLDNHGEAVTELNKVWDENAALRALALDMGCLIRSMDEGSAYSEWWTQDGDYIIDSRFPK